MAARAGRPHRPVPDPRSDGVVGAGPGADGSRARFDASKVWLARRLTAAASPASSLRRRCCLVGNCDCVALAAWCRRPVARLGDDRLRPDLDDGGAGGAARCGWGCGARPTPAAPTIGRRRGAGRWCCRSCSSWPPDGTWRPSLVEPGSDRTAADAMSATFRLRDGAAWSDGAPITVEDLRRTADGRLVAGVDGPDAGRRHHGALHQAAAGRGGGCGRAVTRRCPRPAPGVWGGPFVVARSCRGWRRCCAATTRGRGGAKGRSSTRCGWCSCPTRSLQRQLLEPRRVRRSWRRRRRPTGGRSSVLTAPPCWWAGRGRGSCAAGEPCPPRRADAAGGAIVASTTGVRRHAVAGRGRRVRRPRGLGRSARSTALRGKTVSRPARRRRSR